MLHVKVWILQRAVLSSCKDIQHDQCIHNRLAGYSCSFEPVCSLKALLRSVSLGAAASIHVLRTREGGAPAAAGGVADARPQQQAGVNYAVQNEIM